MVTGLAQDDITRMPDLFFEGPPAGRQPGYELLEPGLVPKHQWRPITGKAAVGTPNIQWGAVGRKPYDLT